MRPLTSIVALIGSAVLLAHDAWCQRFAADSVFVADAVASAIATYEQTQRGQVALYNGGEYIPIPEPYEGFPFFASEYLEEGSVKYSGELFHDVPMEYDLFQDQLVIEHYDQKGYITEVRLHNDLVDYFDLLGHRFINVRQDPAWGGLRPGYYDLLHDGTIKLLCKRKKNPYEWIENRMVNIKFIEKNAYYLVRDGQAIVLKNQATVVKALADKKKALRQFARANRLKDVDKEKMMISLVQHYESLD
jgi:hypothetical protein